MGRNAIIMYRLFGHYVELACKNDLETFASSGFTAVSTGHRNPPQPVAVPLILSLDQGNTGQLLVTIRPVAHARHYELRYAAVPAAGAAVHWTTIVAFFFVPVVKLIVDVFDEGAARLTSAAFSGSNLENGFVFNDALTPESSIYLLSQRIHRMILHQSSLAPEFTRTRVHSHRQ